MSLLKIRPSKKQLVIYLDHIIAFFFILLNILSTDVLDCNNKIIETTLKE